MTDILDKIDTSLEEVEERLLSRLARFRSENHRGYFRLGDAAGEKFREAAERLNDRLEHSGDTRRLELRTERHEVLQARIGVIRQLIEDAIPASAVHDAHEAIENSRRRLEKRVSARRKKTEDDSGHSSRTSVFKPLFDREASDIEQQRNRLKVSEQEELELQDVDVYLDGGIYSASRELAMLANLIKRGATDEPPPDQPRGRAVFEARELSTSLPPVNKVKPVKEESPPEPPQKEEKRDIAQTPEEIRRKLAARQYKSAGKASFVSRDIKSTWPEETHKESDDTEDSEDNASKQGKSMFESRDLTHSPWKKD